MHWSLLSFNCKSSMILFVKVFFIPISEIVCYLKIIILSLPISHISFSVINGFEKPSVDATFLCTHRNVIFIPYTDVSCQYNDGWDWWDRNSKQYNNHIWWLIKSAHNQNEAQIGKEKSFDDHAFDSLFNYPYDCSFVSKFNKCQQ